MKEENTMKKKTAFYSFRLLLLTILAVLGLGTTVSAAPVRGADVTAPAAGNVLVGVEGTFTRISKEIVLKRINEIRREACREGVRNPDSYEELPLTMDDYKPVKWSADLERIAQLRAAEATVYEGHTRPNGYSCFQIGYQGAESYGENLAWNWSGMLDGIEQWYDEKEDWVKKTGGVTGHYTALISPSFSYLGLGTFQRASGGWYATAGEFSGASGLDETQRGVSGKYIQTIEVQKSRISKPVISGSKTVALGRTATLSLTQKISYPGIMGGTNTTTGLPLNPVSWKSSNGSIASVTSSGQIIARKTGKTTITAQTGELGTASCTVTVQLPARNTKLKVNKTTYTVTGVGKTVKYTKDESGAAAVKIPGTVKIGGITYKVTAVANNAFKNNKKLTKVTIGNYVTDIGKNAFYNCKKLKTVIIGKNVKKIGSKAFYGCKALKNITIKTKKLTAKTVGTSAFKSIYGKAVFKVPASKVNSYKALFKAKGAGKKIKVKK